MEFETASRSSSDAGPNRLMPKAFGVAQLRNGGARARRYYSRAGVRRVYALGSGEMSDAPSQAFNGSIELEPVVAATSTAGADAAGVTGQLAAGSAALGIGSSLLNKDIIESENWPELERLAKQHADKLAELKTKLRR